MRTIKAKKAHKISMHTEELKQNSSAILKIIYKIIKYTSQRGRRVCSWTENLSKQDALKIKSALVCDGYLVETSFVGNKTMITIRW